MPHLRASGKCRLLQSTGYRTLSLWTSARNGKFYKSERYLRNGQSKILEHSEDNINVKRKKLISSNKFIWLWHSSISRQTGTMTLMHLMNRNTVPVHFEPCPDNIFPRTISPGQYPLRQPIQLRLQLRTPYFHQFNIYLARIPCINPAYSQEEIFACIQPPFQRALI